MEMIRKIILKSFILAVALSFVGCYPAIRKKVLGPEDALVRIRFFYPTFRDDMGTASLALAIRRNLEYLNRLSPEYVFSYGPNTFTCRQVRESQEAFLALISKNPDPGELNKRIRKDFLVYRAAGRTGKRKVLFTGYFEPVYEAGLRPDETFKYPIYERPDDLIKVDLSLFSDEFRGKGIIARIEDKKVLPYFSRKEIEVEKVLAGRGLELAWLKDPVDVDFLQIQGSGRLELKEGGAMRVGYAAKNGRPYRSIGRYLLDKGVLVREEMSMQRIRSFLIEHPGMIDEVLNHDASYVFFRNLRGGPLVGNINVPITPGRTLALDYRLFPRGALAFISTEKPVIGEAGGEVRGWRRFSRFVLNQDTGGAIRGAGRADLFWGSGPYAEAAAGHMQHEGDLYILIKKP
jgi:membrane-bound lytic murein transglycosylase A